MGYDTRYKITEFLGPGTLLTTSLVTAQFLVAFDESPKGDKYTFRHVFGGEVMTWYNHEIHIEDAMLKSGALLLILHGEGAEHADVWDKRFKLQADGTISVEERRYTLTPNKWATASMRKAQS